MISGLGVGISLPRLVSVRGIGGEGKDRMTAGEEAKSHRIEVILCYTRKSSRILLFVRASIPLKS